MAGRRHLNAGRHGLLANGYRQILAVHLGQNAVCRKFFHLALGAVQRNLMDLRRQHFQVNRTGHIDGADVGYGKGTGGHIGGIKPDRYSGYAIQRNHTGRQFNVFLVVAVKRKLTAKIKSRNAQFGQGADRLGRARHIQGRNAERILQIGSIKPGRRVDKHDGKRQFPHLIDCQVDIRRVAVQRGVKQQIADRVGQIKAQINETQSDYDKEQLQERLAKIAGGVAVIGVGAATEVEMKDKKLRIEDALSATKAAVEEGIVSGGGTALINVIPKVSKLVDTLENGEKLGAQIVLKALEEPVKQIAVNAGLEPAVIVNKVKESEAGIGFDAANEQYVDMKKVGIVDPTKVTRSALQNAASIASMVLTTESLVTDAPEPKNCNCGSQEGGMPAGMDGMY